MAQQMSVKLSRSDASPWGFRLQGGKDFGSPLLIQKVNGGSPAERAGLQAGDAVIKVNNVEVFNLRHKEAQDQIVKAGNGFEITVQRGGSTWKPAVIPVGPQPVTPHSAGHITPVTKTSLAANKPAASPIGSAHNYSPAPFAQQQVNGNGMDPVKSIVNKQYNSPVGIYSEETIAETLSAQAEVLAGGVLGVNFKKNERNYDPKNSEVFKMLNEIANEPRTPEPEAAAPMFERQASVPAAPAAVPFSVAGLRRVTAPETRPADEQKTVLPPGQNICAECERLVVGVFVRIKDKNLHVECFKCATCGTSLKNVGYYNINNKLYCDVHAKLVARQHPPAPNLEPITIPPGAQKPAGAISAALASRAAPAPVSPQPSNFAPMPFHAPGGFAGVRPSFNAAAPMKQPTAPSAPVPAPFTTPAKPAPVNSKLVWPPMNLPDEESSTLPTATPLYIPPAPLNQSAPIMSAFETPADANPSKRKSSMKSESTVQGVPQVQPFPEPYSEFITHQPVARPMSAYQYTPKPLGTNDERPRSAFADPKSNSTFQPVASTHSVTFDDAVQIQESGQFMSTNFEESSSSTHHKKFSMCSQEVMGITERHELSASLEQLSETIDTAMLVSQLTGRPESPVPMEHMQSDSLQEVATQDEEPRIETTHATSEQKAVGQQVTQSKRSSIGQIPSAPPMPWKCPSPFVAALSTAPERPYSPLPTSPSAQAEPAEAPKTLSPRPTTLPVSYRQLPQPSEGFIPIPQDEPNTAPLPVDIPHHSNFISALTIAPDRPYSPLPQPMAPLPIKPVPLPEQTEPYHVTREVDNASPLLSALTVAPKRPYSPFTVTKAPTSILDSIQVMQSNINVGEPFNLPTPSAYTSMLSALTIAPERPYTPLCVTQAPTLTTETTPAEAHREMPVKTEPSKIVENVQVYKPEPQAASTIESQVPQPEPPKSIPPISEGLMQVVEALPAKLPVVQVPGNQAKSTKGTSQKHQQTQKTTEKTTTKQKAVTVESQKTSKTETAGQPTNALSLQRQSLQRPITPNMPRPVTPSMISGLHKPATIPYYQQNIGDGDFPCRSPRPTTPNLICPMTVPRPATPGVTAARRSITPIPHKQLEVVRALTPVQRAPVKQSMQSQQVAVSESQQHNVAQNFASKTSTQQSPQVVVTRKTHVKEEFETFHKESTQVIEKSGTTRKCISQSEQSSAMAQQSDLHSKEVTSITNGAVTQRESSTLQSNQLAAQAQQYSYDSLSNSQSTQSAQLLQQSFQQSQSVPQIQPITAQKPQDILSVQTIPKNNFMSLEESQRASPLPFPNISLPEGMMYEVVDNKALYTSGKNKQVFKLNQPNQMCPSKEVTPQFQAPAIKAPSIQALAPKFEKIASVCPAAPCAPAQCPVSICPAAPCAPAQCPVSFCPLAPSAPAQGPVSFGPQQPTRQVKFQPVAPHPAPAVSQPIQAPTATLPVHVMSTGQHANSSFQPTISQGINSFTPKSSGNGFQNFTPKAVASQPAPCPTTTAKPDSFVRRASGAFQVPPSSSAPGPNVSQGYTPRRTSQGAASRGAQDVFPKNVSPAIRAPGLTDPCTSPPNAGGGSAPKGGSVAGTSAPVRGRGVLSQPGGPGARQALCPSCQMQIRGPFVTALGKTWCPEHFVCSNGQCRRQLADIGFVEEKGQLYCEYCFEQFIAPGCDKCSKKIKGDCLNAIGKHFHPECFACSYCNKLFGNNPFFLEDGMPYCQADWNELFTTKCFACGFPIEAGDRWVEALNNNYHSQCFNCTSCKKNLEGQSFFAKSGRPFCKAHAR